MKLKLHLLILPLVDRHLLDLKLVVLNWYQFSSLHCSSTFQILCVCLWPCFKDLLRILLSWIVAAMHFYYSYILLSDFCSGAGVDFLASVT